MDVLSPDGAGAAVRRLTPLPARTLTELGRGTDIVAYLVDGWVFRFPAVANARRTCAASSRCSRGCIRRCFDLAVIAIFFDDEFLVRQRLRERLA